jgi:hypothetical protein
MDGRQIFDTGTHKLVIRLLLGAGLAFAAFSTAAGASTPVEAPTPPVVEVQIGSVEPVKTVAQATTTTTTTVPAFQPDPDALCPEWHETALEAGWPEDVLSRLDYIMWRESRCLPEAFNPTDPNGGSIGLTQINRFWCIPTRYNPDGWLQGNGLVSDCNDLYDPVTNLTAALAIWEYAETNGCGWSPWATRNTRWC